ncbi:IclR family transcriptional regulator [Salimicrobium flavidum]|uniref:Helix-turn-helix domain-containing protein n=1 Tax=Salimicrobium flavidum TaxID=570947 RepID=A0A1N7JY96_9BACI|nr:hypothetical protein [Salimicrobium flavidum]SIS54174.1 Helix-turn-helix domain-containing protein [Salimicrobium flavidum]
MTTYRQVDLIELRELETFTHQNDMDAAIYDHIAELRANEEPASTIEVLRFFGRSSLRVLGVSFAKLATITEQTGYSLSTVRRAIDKLENYGMIEKHPTTKKWKSYGKSRKKSVNIIVIQPVNRQGETLGTSDEFTPHKAEEGYERNEPFQRKHDSKSTTETESTAMLRHAIPSKLYDVLSPFFEGDAEGLYNAVGTLFRAKSSVDSTILAEDHDEYCNAFLNVMRRYKSGKVRSLNAYLYASWQAVTAEITRRKNRVSKSGLSEGLADWFAGELSQELAEV